MSAAIAQYNFPTVIRFGAGVRTELANAVKSRGASRPLVITDQLVAKLDWMGPMVSSLKAAGLDAAVFDGVIGNPVESQVTAGAAAFRAHDADLIVAVGGGAPVDVAKAIAVMVNHPGGLFDYEDRSDATPIEPDRFPIPRIIAIPTTAGTGSEVGRSAVVSDDESKAKKIIFHPTLLPELVLADPELLVALPSKTTAATGMDALTHLVETFLVDATHPIADGIALEGIYLVAKSLTTCVRYARRLEAGEKLSDREAAEHLGARGDLLNASMMGAIAFQKGLGVNHSCAHALSTVLDLHHGLANGIVLPYCMAFNAEVCRDAFARIGIACGLLPGPRPGYAVVDWIRLLRAEIGIPASLADVGVTEAHIPQLVDVALADACHASNPRPVGRTDFEELFRRAIAG